MQNRIFSQVIVQPIHVPEYFVSKYPHYHHGQLEQKLVIDKSDQTQAPFLPQLPHFDLKKFR